MTFAESKLRRRIQFGTWVMIIGLIISGVTALPLQTELDLVARWLGAEYLAPEQATTGFVKWILMVREALHVTNSKYPFLAYGTDWLAFAHIVIAIAFVGALQHPLRNSWLFTFGMIASVLVIPWALFIGQARGVPIYWRLIDCSFGVAGFIPCWLCHKWARQLEKIHATGPRLD
jgi:hypothetical protein